MSEAMLFFIGVLLHTGVAGIARVAMLAVLPGKGMVVLSLLVPFCNFSP